MELFFDLLLTLLVELPIIAFFFSRRKRRSTLAVAFMVNVATWPVAHIIRLRYPDLSPVIIKSIIAVLEIFPYWYFLGRNWKKAILISLVANGASLLATTFIKYPASWFQTKQNMIR